MDFSNFLRPVIWNGSATPQITSAEARLDRGAILAQHLVRFRCRASV
jgi:hypothetical protein